MPDAQIPEVTLKCSHRRCGNHAEVDARLCLQTFVPERARADVVAIVQGQPTDNALQLEQSLRLLPRRSLTHNRRHHQQRCLGWLVANVGEGMRPVVHLQRSVRHAKSE